MYFFKSEHSYQIVILKLFHTNLTIFIGVSIQISALLLLDSKTVQDSGFLRSTRYSKIFHDRILRYHPILVSCCCSFNTDMYFYMDFFLSAV